MAETSGGDHSETGATKPKRRRGVYLDWAFRVLLGLFALPSLVSTIILFGYFAHDLPGLTRALLYSLPLPLACAVLILPWRILLKNRAMKAVALIAGCLVAHQLYASFGTFQALARSPKLFMLSGGLLLAGVLSLVLYTRHTQRKMWPAALSAALVLVCFIFGAGNPQWSRFIFVWQVHYSPWKRDSANLPTNRGDVRMILPKYTEWDALGRKVAEWTHPNGELLRTLYYPNGRKRMERLYAEDQFVTSWYPDGRMEYQYDRQTRRRRAWDPNGAPREGLIRESLPGSDRVEVVQEYKDGYYDGVHQFWSGQGGRLIREAHYRDGRQDGVSREWNAQGVLVGEEYYADGYRHGPRRRFRQDGSLEWEETYDHGVLQGSRKTFPPPK